jgi:hypothetical protein
MYTQRLTRPLRVLVDPEASDAARVLAKAEVDLYARRGAADGEKVEGLMSRLKRMVREGGKKRRRV